MTNFRDVRDYVAIPRLTALRLSADGSWLAAVVQARSRDGKKFVSSIWRIDASPGAAEPARLTRSAEGETSPEFLPDGSLLFISARRIQPESPTTAARPGSRGPTAAPVRPATTALGQPATTAPGRPATMRRPRRPRCGYCPPGAVSPAGSLLRRAGSAAWPRPGPADQ